MIFACQLVGLTVFGFCLYVVLVFGHKNVIRGLREILEMYAVDIRIDPTPYYGFGIYFRVGAGHGDDFSFFFQVNFLKLEFVFAYSVPNKEYWEPLKQCHTKR